MTASGVGRLAIVSAAVLFPEKGLDFMFFRWLLRHHPRDLYAMEGIVRASGLAWTIARPPRLTRSRDASFVAVRDALPAGSRVMSSRSVAAFMLDAVERRSHVAEVVGLARGVAVAAPLLRFSAISLGLMLVTAICSLPLFFLIRPLVEPPAREATRWRAAILAAAGATPFLIVTILGGVASNRRLAARLLRLAHRRAAGIYQTITQHDTRAPILFLRSFKEEKRLLEPPARSLLAKVLRLRDSRRTLDEIVLDAASPVGPVVALGIPAEKAAPLSDVLEQVRAHGSQIGAGKLLVGVWFPGGIVTPIFAEDRSDYTHWCMVNLVLAALTSG